MELLDDVAEKEFRRTYGNGVRRRSRKERMEMTKLKRVEKTGENDGEMPSVSLFFCFCFAEGAAAIKYLQRL